MIWPLYLNVELRAMTKSHRIRESAVMISSTMPSAKYSCSGSPLMLANGSTAIDGLSGSGRAGGSAAPARVLGLDPRLSGSDWVPLERQLSRIDRGWRLNLQQTVEAPAVHQICAHEAGEDERAGDRVLRGLGHAQQQKGDQSDGDLDAHGVFAGAEKAADLEGLLDPAEEQLDRPAALIEIGDLPGGGVEVVAQDAQHLAGVELDAHFPHRVLEGVEPIVGLAPRQMADTIGEDDGAGGYWQFLDHRQRRVGFEPGDDAALRPVELGPPVVIVIAEVEHISC